MPLSAAVVVKSPPVPIGVVTNPNSKRNQALNRVAPRKAALQAIVGRHGVVCETASLEDLGPAVERLLERGVRFLVADGGDGTLHWLINAVWRATDGDAAAMPLFVPTCGGTINFVARRAGITGRSDAVLRALVEAEQAGGRFPVIGAQTLRLAGQPGGAADGERVEHLGFCAAIAGVGQRFFDLYYADARPGPWTIVKVIAKGLGSMLANLPGLRRVAPARWRRYVIDFAAPQRARVTVDGETLPGERWRAVDVGAIAVNFGGVVRMFPLAAPGRLHLLTGNPALWRIALTVPRLVLGLRLKHGLSDRAVGHIEVEALGGKLLRPVIDGERFPGLARIDVRPGPSIRIPQVPTVRRLLGGG